MNEKKPYSAKASSWHSKKPKRIGVLFSAFDFIHPGHIAMLKDAKAQCDYLIVGVQTDPTVDSKYRKKAGKEDHKKNKPIYALEERLEMIEAIKYIDEHFVYTTEEELYAWLQNNDWDVRILGSDWRGAKYTGHDIKKGEVYFHKRTHDLSSTEIRRRLNMRQE